MRATIFATSLAAILLASSSHDAFAGDPPAGGSESVAPVGSATPPAEDAPWTRGWVRLRYVYRAAPAGSVPRHQTDQDFSQDLFAEGGVGEHFRYEVSARVHEDIDGRPQVSRFRDVYDTYDSWATAWLYTAYVEAIDVDLLGRLRVGRQYLEDGVDVRFDGALVESSPLWGAVRLIAYGGIPAPLFRGSVRNDWLAGGAIEVIAIPRTNIRFDYTHVTDFVRDEERLRNFQGVAIDGLRDDDRFQLTIVHRPIDALKLFGRASTYDGRSTRGEAEVVLQPIDTGFVARVRYTVQVGAYRDLSVFFDPFTAQLGVYRPYHEILGEVRQTVFEVLVLRAGGGLRKLFHGGDEGTFNHEFGRVFGGFELVDWPLAGFNLSGLAEWYRTLAIGRSFQASFEVSQLVGGGVTVGFGSQYAAFKLDEQFLVERQNARTFEGFLQWKPAAFFRARATYSYETNNEDKFHMVRFDARIDF